MANMSQEEFLEGHSEKSAKMLALEVATQMRGRLLTFELFPFSFPEYHYRTKQGNEIDFYWIDHENKANLVQVSHDVLDKKTGIHSSTLVTMNQSDQINVEKRMINIIPAWRYFIQS
jgi:predicted AAA+ superfamily ATPase